MVILCQSLGPFFSVSFRSHPRGFLVEEGMVRESFLEEVSREEEEGHSTSSQPSQISDKGLADTRNIWCLGSPRGYI
jgi:hypothetical protein